VLEVCEKGRGGLNGVDVSRGRVAGGLERACVVVPARFFYPVANTEALLGLTDDDDGPVQLLLQRLRGMSDGGGGGVFAAHLWARSWCADSRRAQSASAARDCSTLPLVHRFVLQCDAVRCSVMQCDAVCCSVLQHVAACCSVLQRVAAWDAPFFHF